jgi:predicted ATPase
VGFGLSQVLPVVVQLVANSNSLILIEQPEIHLHPRIQSRMADLMIQSVVERGNRLLVETHSEHILMRLQRRIREGAVSGFNSGRVAVSYVSGAAEGSTVSAVRMDETGKLTDPWPDGFFDERLEDLFAGL